MKAFHFLPSNKKRGKKRKIVLISSVILLSFTLIGISAAQMAKQEKEVVSLVSQNPENQKGEPSSFGSRDTVGREMADRNSKPGTSNEKKNPLPKNSFSKPQAKIASKKSTENISVAENKGELDSAPAEIKTSEQPIAAQISKTVNSIIDLINIERAKVNLPSLKENSLLDKAAFEKSKDMAERNYFSHTTPDGLSDFDFIKAAGYKFKEAGSNIAEGDFKDDQGLVDAWMASPGHKANILADYAADFGYGAYGKYFTMFVAKPLN